MRLLTLPLVLNSSVLYWTVGLFLTFFAQCLLFGWQSKLNETHFSVWEHIRIHLDSTTLSHVTSLRHELFLVNQTNNFLTIVAYDTKTVVTFWNMLQNPTTIAESDHRWHTMHVIGHVIVWCNCSPLNTQPAYDTSYIAIETCRICLLLTKKSK